MRVIALAFAFIALVGLAVCRDAPPTGPHLPQFACGETSCDVGEFCGHYRGGRVDPDTGQAPHNDSCDPLPSPCTAAPSCDCLRGAGVAFTGCDDAGGHPAISVLAP